MASNPLRKTDRTRLQLVRAVRLELEQQGTITAGAVAKRANSSPATFYNHFASQDDALLAAFTAAMQDLVEVVRTGLDIEQVLEQGMAAFLRDWTWTCIEFFRANALVFGKARAQLHRADEFIRVFSHHEHEALEIYQRFVRLGQRAGLIKRDDTSSLAQVLMLTCQGWNHPRVLNCQQGDALHDALVRSTYAMLVLDTEILTDCFAVKGNVMKTQIHATYSSNLPADDPHPYRSGPWRPQVKEYDAWDLPVDGEIPRDLAGTYLRNTENPLHLPLSVYHPFDGDGMLHSMHFADGQAVYHNRFVPTDGFRAEQQAGEALFAGVAESPTLAKQASQLGARENMKDASSTDVVVHRGRALSSFWMCGDLYASDPVTLEPLGKEDFDGQFPGDWGVSAHTKIDECSGEMLFFNYGKQAPYMHYGVVDAQGKLAHYVDVELPGPRLPHDMAFTENFAILNDCPMFWDPQLLKDGHHMPRFFDDLPTRFGILPRRGDAGSVRWFEAAPTFVLHWMNAYEDGDEIVLDGFFQENPSPQVDPQAGFEKNLFRYLDLFTMRAKAHRWRFNLRTGETREEHLSDRIQEFGMINGRVGGRPYRYSYNALPCEGWFGFRGIIKQDVQSGREEVVELPEGMFASETVMAPRVGATAEDDGYLITFVMDMNADRSECWVLNAAAPSDGPIARVALPERIASGTHGFWHAAS